MEEINKIPPLNKQVVPERLQIDKGFDGRYKLLVVAGAFLLGIIADLFFYDHRAGVAFPIFAILLLVYFFVVNRKQIGGISIIHILLLAAMLLLSLSFALFNNGFLLFLDFFAVLLLIGAYTLSITDKNISFKTPAFTIDIFSRAFYLSFSNYFKPVVFVIEALPKGDKTEKSSLRKNILIGLLASGILLVMIIPMLMAADMAFKYYLTNITKLFENINTGTMVFHFVFVTVLSLYFFGYTWSFKYPYKAVEIKTVADKGIEPVIVITVLTVINLLYLLFSILQFSFLYAGASHVLPEGLTYADYARSGFFDLVRVTIINLLIILSAMKFTKLKSGTRNKGIKGLLSLMIAFTGNMLFSAYYRMSLYEQTYGYTELRIYVYAMILFLFLVLVMTLVKIWKDKMPLFTASLAVGLVLFIGLNYMNVEKMIAGNNIDRYYKTGIIDMDYLSSLSVDAVPEIARLANDADSAVASRAQEILKRNLDRLEEQQAWMEYNRSAVKAKAMLEKMTLKH